jgi:hypothetical protein
MTLDRPVTLSFPGAIQAIAALEDRIAGPLRWRDTAVERRDALEAVDAIRETFGIRRMTEAEMDAAHEAATAYLDHADLSVDEVRAVPLAGIEQYQAEGR